jgi:hypothetical protein
MVQFIEKHRRLLQAYCLIARILGWFLILGGVFWVALVRRNMVGGLPHIPDILKISYALQAVILNFVFLGLVALGVAQFIKYVFAREDQPGFLLRIGDKILYVYAGLLILGAILTWVFQMLAIKAAAVPTFLISFAGLLLPAMVKALILIGLGKILKRVIPVIEESKTLV